MELIAPLISGMVGATSGTVRIYRRGTSTRATLYSDFEGASSLANTADLTLDANGRREIYVNEPVDVTVISSAGASLITFTVGSAAPAMEYQGIGFSGVDYETAVAGTGSGYPTTLQAIADLWFTKTGATNWDVLYGGVATTLKNALKLGIFFNVKELAYGAVGDGSTDDTAAIAAAITAAGVAGGIVYFPGGTYRITSILTISSSVSLMGAGANVSIIKMDHATAETLSITGSGSGTDSFVCGIRFNNAQANTGKLIKCSATTVVSVEKCVLGDGNSNAGTLFDTGAVGDLSRISIRGCLFLVGSSTGSAISGTGVSGQTIVEDCIFIPPATCNSTLGIVSGKGITLTRCRFYNTAVTAGTFSCFTDGASSTALKARITDCEFNNGGGATVTAMTLGTYGATSVFYEDNNIFGSTVTAYSYTVSAAQAGAKVRLETRENRTLYATNATGAYEVPLAQYGNVVLTNSTAGNVTITATMPPDGARGNYWIYNSNGLSRDFTTAGPFIVTATVAIAAAGVQSWMCFAMIDDTGANTNYILSKVWV